MGRSLRPCFQRWSVGDAYFGCNAAAGVVQPTGVLHHLNLFAQHFTKDSFYFDFPRSLQVQLINQQLCYSRSFNFHYFQLQSKSVHYFDFQLNQHFQFRSPTIKI